MGKGYFNAKSYITSTSDTLVNNSKILKINIEKGNKFKINEIIINGNYALSDDKIKRLMKDTKQNYGIDFTSVLSFNILF